MSFFLSFKMTLSEMPYQYTNMKYTDLQKRLTELKDGGALLSCSIRSSREKLEVEYERLLAGQVILTAGDKSIEKVDDKKTSITVLGIDDDHTIITSIRGESHIVPVYWDEERDTAISINREVIVTSKHQDWDESKSSDICKIEYLGDGQGNYRAFPLSTVQGYSEWLYPGKQTRYHAIKARISLHDTASKSINISKENQRPTILTSEDICIVRIMEDVHCGITRYYPSIGTFHLMGRHWLLADNNPDNVRWISTVQAVRQPSLTVGSMVFLQGDIGTKGKLDYYRIDKVLYAGLCLMAHCTNQRTLETTIVPLVQLHLPSTLRR